jgi:hypothetical protein
MLNNRHSRAAAAIATELETKNSVVVNVSTPEADSHIFRVMAYLNHYYGKYWIKYSEDGTGIIMKQE